MEKTKEQLELENADYKKKMEIDLLTGLYNRGTMEGKVNEYLKSDSRGSMIAIDLDYFKQVNDRYGHIAGDQLLKDIGGILNKMFGGRNLVGRVGGDEFAIFMPVDLDEAALKSRCVQIKERFREMRVKNTIPLKISMTVSWSRYQEDDSYSSLFDRADQKIMEKKRIRNIKRGKVFQPGMDSGIELDMSLIAGEMQENNPLPGAYCQDYDTFKSIFRFTERRLRRVTSTVYMILFTLTDADNNFPTLDKRDYQMEVLGKGIQDSLRMGDIFTQYSSCQYLVMVSDVTQESAEMIAERISRQFYDSRKEDMDEVVIHHCYPLKAAGK